MVWRGLLPAAAPESVPFRLRHLALEVLVALSLAFLVWLYFRTRDHESLDHVPVPVQITLGAEFADRYDLEVTGPPHVSVSFVGSPSGVRELRGMLQRGEVRVSLPLAVPPDRRAESHFRDSIRVDASAVPVPPGVVAVVAEGGNRIPVTFHRLVERRLPVRLNHAAEDRLNQVSIDPPTVLVRGPEDILERVHSIPTRFYHVPLCTAPEYAAGKVFSVPLTLARELEGRPIRCLPEAVKVRLSLQPRPRVYQLRRVAVRFLCPTSFPFQPRFHSEEAGRLTLRVRAPASTEPPAVLAYIDLTRGRFKPGLNMEPIRLQLPRDCQLLQDPPPPLEFELVPTEPASGWLGVVTEPSP